jgi:hypothetical protein
MTYSEQWLALRDSLADNPGELSQARKEALVAVKRWAQKWHDQLPAAAVADLADAVGAVVAAHGGTVVEGASIIEACRAAGRAGSVRELGDCMAFLREEAPHRLGGLGVADRNPPRRGLDGTSAWADFLWTSGDVREGETEADASRRVAAAPQAPSPAEELLRG